MYKEGDILYVSNTEFNQFPTSPEHLGGAIEYSLCGTSGKYAMIDNDLLFHFNYYLYNHIKSNNIILYLPLSEIQNILFYKLIVPLEIKLKDSDIDSLIHIGSNGEEYKIIRGYTNTTPRVVLHYLYGTTLMFENKKRVEKELALYSWYKKYGGD